MSSTSAPIYPANTPIPIDLFIPKKHPGLPRGVLGFADSSGNIVYRVNHKSSSYDKAVLLDSAGNPLFSLYSHHDGSWQGFKGDDGEKDLIFKVQRILTKLTRTELEVFLVAENEGEVTCDFKVIGCHFQRSCTIYKGDSIVAQELVSLSHVGYTIPVDSLLSEEQRELNSWDALQCTSLMHKLRQIYVSRSKFRLTIFPGPVDPSLVVALVVIFLFSGPKKFRVLDKFPISV